MRAPWIQWLRNQLHLLRHELRPVRLFWWVLAVGILPSILLRRYPSTEGAKDRPDPRKFIIFQFGGIGDTLMLTPIVRELRRAYPGATFDLAFVHGYVKLAMAQHPYFRKVIAMEYYPRGYSSLSNVADRAGGVAKVLYYFPGLFVRTALGRYDVALLFPLSEPVENLTGAIAFSCRIPLRVGLGSRDLGYLHRSFSPDYCERHRVDSALRVLDVLHAPTTGKQLGHRYDFPLFQAEKEWAKSFLGSPQRGIRRPLFALHPGGMELSVPRRWPARYFGEVGRWLVRKTGGTILVTGTASEGNVCDEVVSMIGEGCINVCGETSIRQTAAILAECDFCLTNDTGVLHLAAAVGVRCTVAIFGPQKAELLVPRGYDIRAVQGNLPCIPCVGSVINNKTKRCFRAITGECLQKLKPKDVFPVLEGMLRDYDVI